MRRDAWDDGDNVAVSFSGIQATTEKAIRIVIDDYDDAHWIPRSQIAHLDEEKGELWIPLWLAEKKGLDFK